jgi:type I restriction enzyme M protein
MADEYAKPPYKRDIGIPEKYTWPILKAKRGAELEGHYIELLRELGKRKDVLGQIFTKSQNKIQDPAKLYRLIDMIDEVQWVTMDADVKGDIYEGLLEKNAEDKKSGAGQYFTPRALIKAMVECVRPEPAKTIADPACGTGGFFLACYDFLTNTDNYDLDKAQKAALKYKTFQGNEIVAGTRRLCLMNMFLHNIGEIDGDAMISPNDALVAASGQSFDYVLANPPFGKKSSMSFTNDEGEEETDDLTYIIARIFGLRHQTNSSISCSTFARCSRPRGVPPSLSPTTSCSRAEPARPFVRTFSRLPTCTLSYAFRPVFFMRTV